jgi:hypothetical protein
MIGTNLSDLEVENFYTQGTGTFNGDVNFNAGFISDGFSEFNGIGVVGWTADNSGAGGNYSMLIDTLGEDDGGMVVRTGDTNNNEKALSIYNHLSEAVFELTGTEGDITMGEPSTLSKVVSGTSYTILDTAGKIHRPTYNDIAEWTEKSEESNPGDVLIWEDGGTKPSYKAGSNKVMGVHSDPNTYGMILGGSDETMKEKEKIYAPLGLAGKALVNVIGPVNPMDQLETSEIKGHARRSIELKAGTIVGKALESVKDGEQKKIWAMIYNS